MASPTSRAMAALSMGNAPPRRRSLTITIVRICNKCLLGKIEDTSVVNEGKEVVQATLVADHEAAEVVAPGEQPRDLRAPARAAILEAPPP